MIPLDKRLELIASFVRLKDADVVDIGTDHALIPCYLREKGVANVIASDIGLGPLKSAKRTADYYNIDKITFLQSDGVENIDYADDLIIAGMGGELISRIISQCREKNFTHESFRLILQPMTHPEKVRKALYLNGYEIISEKAVQQKDKHYCIIYALYSGKEIKIDDAFAFWGKVNDENYINYKKNKLKKILSKLENSQKNDSNRHEKARISRLINYIENQKKGMN
ncbi:MAG: SAM-dependent methyltransferase [Clostridiales bacterium]|nr:SAM-dependent methyltransferase [Clostridiales bacterium]